MSRFQLSGLDHRLFQSLFLLDEPALAALGAVRCVADSASSYPCRVSLEDASIGEDLLLVPYRHQLALSPYRSSGPIYVRRVATQALLTPGQVPVSVTRRLISLRSYDDQDRIVAAEVYDGARVAAALEQVLAGTDVAMRTCTMRAQGAFPVWSSGWVEDISAAG